MTNESVAQLLEKLTNGNYIQAQLVDRRSPSFPPNWKAGLVDRTLGKDAPWGDVNLAWTLLQNGKIEEGRELLRRLCKHQPNIRANLALGAFELVREPEDRTESSRLLGELAQRFPNACEFHALRTIGLFDRSPRLAHESYRKNSRDGDSVLSKYLDDLQEVCISDIQWRIIFGKVGDSLESFAVQSIYKGVAMLLLRKQREGLLMFAKGYQQSDQMPDFYERHHGLKLTESQRASLIAMFGVCCLQGLQLTLFDVGLDDLAGQAGNLVKTERQRLKNVLVQGLS